MLRFLIRIVLFPVYFVLMAISAFAALIVHFASVIIGIVLTVVFIGGICAAFMQDFHTVSTAFIMVGIASVLLTIVGFAQGFIEMIRDSVGGVVFG